MGVKLGRSLEGDNIDREYNMGVKLGRSLEGNNIGRECFENSGAENEVI